MTGLRTDRWDRPLIGVIGPENPWGDYEPDMGRNVGWAIRESTQDNGYILLEAKKGTGVHVFEGIARRAQELDGELNTQLLGAVKHGSKTVALPSSFESLRYAFGQIGEHGEMDKPKLFGMPNEMHDYLLAESDLIVLVSGGYDTLRQAMSALDRKIPVITLPETSGAAKLLETLATTGEMMYQQGSTEHQFTTEQVPVQDLHITDLEEVQSTLYDVMQSLRAD